MSSDGDLATSRDSEWTPDLQVLVGGEPGRPFALLGWEHHRHEDALRSAGPVHRVTYPSGLPVHVVTRGLERTRALLSDHRLVKGADRVTAAIRSGLVAAGRSGELSSIVGSSLLFSDPPEHTWLRKVVSTAFSRRRVEELRPRIEGVVEDLLDGLDTGTPVDLVEAVALPLPLTVICELLGIPDEARPWLQQWSADLMTDVPEVAIPASQAMGEYLAALAQRKAQRPDEALLSGLVHAEVDGHRLSPEQVVTTAILMVVAGHETTTGLISNAVVALLAHQGTWSRLAERPDAVADALEEVHRWDSPVRVSPYYLAAEDVDVDGVVIPAGSVVLLSFGPAGRDPQAHGPTAGVFDPFRGAAPGYAGHVGFGHGVHFCLGHFLAKTEVRTAFAELTRRWPRARLVDDPHRLIRRTSVITSGFAAAEVELIR